MSKKIYKVAIVYHYIAHYRKAIFQKLSLDKDIDYTIISGCEPDIDIKLLDLKYSEIPIKSGGIRWKLLKNKWHLNKFLFQKGLHKELTNQIYDAVIFMGNAYFLSTWIEALICRFKGIPIMMWGHGLIRFEFGLKGFIRRLFYRLANTHFIYSARSINIMRNSGLGKIKYFQINNSLDYQAHLQIRYALSDSLSPYRNNDFFKIIFIGRLTIQKSLDLLIKAQADLIKRGRHIDVYFIGDGAEKAKLISLAQNLDIIGNVHFLGACYNEQKVGLFLYHADLCVSPGEIGLTAIHSLTYGTPVITHNNFDIQMPEVESIKDGLTGSFFEQGSVESLSHSIDRFTSTIISRDNIREACFQIIDTYFTPDYQSHVFRNGIYETCEYEQPVA